jgi:hypothetical protein
MDQGDQGNYAVSTLMRYLKGHELPGFEGGGGLQRREQRRHAGIGRPDKERGRRTLRERRGGYVNAPGAPRRRLNKGKKKGRGSPRRIPRPGRFSDQFSKAGAIASFS